MRQAIGWVKTINGRLKNARQQRLQNRLKRRLGKLVSYGLS